MTSILSSYMSLTALMGSSSTGSGNSQAASNASQSTAGNMFGDAFSFSLSDEALSMLEGGNANGDASGSSASSILSMLTYSSFSGGSSASSSDDSGLDALLGNLGGTSGGDDFAEDALAGGGPLPAFLAQVDAQMHLDPAHQKALQDIATQYMDAPDTQETVMSIAAALQQAGI